MQTSINFYTNNEKPEIEMENTSCNSISKCLEIHFMKYVQDQYAENYQTYGDYIKLTGQKTQYCKYVNYLQLIGKFNAYLIKIPKSFFFLVEINKVILKFTWKCKQPRIAKTIWK